MTNTTERSMTGPSLSDELERVKRALVDQQERFRDEPVMLRPDDVRVIISGIQRLLEREERMREALERVPLVAYEQRCERGTPWDLACVTIGEKLTEYARTTLSGEGA